MRECQVFGCREIDDRSVFLGIVETPLCDYKVFSCLLPGNREVQVYVKIPGSDKPLAMTEWLSLEALMA